MVSKAFAVLLTIACFTLPVTAIGQENVQQEDPEANAKAIKTPEGWRGETIKLPAPFAKDMKLTGFEVIRFAPGMFNVEKDDFFSYVFYMAVSDDQKFDKATIESEMLAYYRGLAKAVSADKDALDTSRFSIKIKSVDSGDDKESKAKQFAAQLKWIEPFVTNKGQQLNLEMTAFADKKNKKNYLFVCASPAKDDAKIWKQLREIRKTFVESFEE